MSWWSKTSLGRVLSGRWTKEWNAEMSMFQPKTEEAPAVDTTSKDTGRIDTEAAQEIVNRRLSKIGRYYTSPLGVLSSASTGTQKLFS
jgi:hypothetical protein